MENIVNKSEKEELIQTLTGALPVLRAAMHYWIVPKDAPYCQVRLFLRICLQESTSTPFNGLFRQSAALSLLRLHVTP